MRTRSISLFALLAVVGVVNPAWSQGPPYPIPPGDARGPMPVPVPSPLPAGPGPDAPTTVFPNEGGRSGLSDWITYRHGCGRAGCFSTGYDPEIQTEIYLRSGLSFPIAGTFFGDVLGVGWMIQGGGKALFFDDAHLRAWFVDLSLANINNHTTDDSTRRPFVLAGTLTTLREYNRTFVGVGAGRTWYLRGNGLDAGPNWRVGTDGGGRWGSASARFTNLQHTSDVIGGVYLGLQTDLEVPMNCSECMFLMGLRAEWDYTWSDILSRPSDLAGFNLLFNVGVRY